MFKISLLGLCFCKFINEPCWLKFFCFHTLAIWALVFEISQISHKTDNVCMLCEIEVAFLLKWNVSGQNFKAVVFVAFRLRVIGNHFEVH